jgi:glycosyltransferase involved in cell wall biosynthesis
MEHDRPRVSVIVPTFNRSRFIVDCLESLLAQTLPPAELIVVDDQSSDATRSVLATYGDRIVHLETPSQLGKPGAVNLGLEHATGEYIWVFDDDDVAQPDALARFTDTLERHPECGFSWSPWFVADTMPDGSLGPATFETRAPDIATIGFLPALLERNFLGGAALFARKRCYDECGGYDTALVRSQDYDVAIRFARRYAAVRVDGGATFVYRQHEGARGSSSDRFAAWARFGKWLQYDQRILRRLRREMSLGEYLPPGHDVAQSQRLALVQRFTLMTERLLVDEALEDLALLARLPDQKPLTELERRPVRRIAYSDPWYGCGAAWDHARFMQRLRDLVEQSETVRAIRDEVLNGLLRGVRSHGLSRVRVAAPRAMRLFVKTSTASRGRRPAGAPATPMPGPQLQ